MRHQIQVQICRINAPTSHKAALLQIESIVRYTAIVNYYIFDFDSFLYN